MCSGLGPQKILSFGMTQRSRPKAKPIVSEAVVLMAGSGSCLRETGTDQLNQLVTIRDQPLVSYTNHALVQAGVRSIHAVIGFEADALMERLPSLVPPEVAL